MKLKKGIVILCMLFLLSQPGTAAITLPAFFSNNMVLQQNDDVPIWGTTEPGNMVKVQTSWNGKTYNATSDNEGHWQIIVATPGAGGPYTISLSDGQELLLENVLIGEVWICSGQSNMEMEVSKVNNGEQEISAADYPAIRLLQVRRATSTLPVEDVKIDGGGWQVCSPQTISGFSAVAYFFGRDIHLKHHIPIGLIHTSWGGTKAEAWTSAASLKTMDDFKAAVEEMESGPHDRAILERQYREQMSQWTNEFRNKDAGYKNGKPVYAGVNFDDSQWAEMSQPGFWEEKSLAGFDGTVWLRKNIDLPQSWVGEELQLHLSSIDDNDITWFNGREVGRMEGWNRPRVYTIPKDLLKAGKNVVVVRVHDTGGNGGMHGEAAQMYLSNADGDIMSLAGNWHYRIGVQNNAVGPRPAAIDDPNRVSVLYNAMIHPLIPFAIRGAIWYQGESNATMAYQYRELFPLMIADWRKQWQIHDFPFYFVQLANFRSVQENPGESDWAELREAQAMALSLPNTGMAVAIDIGEADDIHPKNKQEVGRRLALIARNKVYKEDVAWSGPVYTSSKIKKNRITLSFKHVNGGLKAEGDGVLKGFSIAGKDRKFYWATARIVGKKVIVSSPNVPEPVAVRYAWADNPVCNLYNGAGLPASPFRTDDWPGITVVKHHTSRAD